MIINMDMLIEKLEERRKAFVSEADFQLELAWQIKKCYPKANVRMEYCPLFDKSMHIDILVTIAGNWIPIELKYKTKACEKQVKDELYILRNHLAKDVNCYAYLKDIQRIEKIKKNVPSFAEGYTVFITNDLSYTNPPRTPDVNYYAFSIHEGATKSGTMDWGEKTGDGTKGKEYKDAIVLEGKYEMKWNIYSTLDSTNTGIFKVLVNKIS